MELVPPLEMEQMISSLIHEASIPLPEGKRYAYKEYSKQVSKADTDEKKQKGRN